MPWWGILLTALGTFAAGVLIGAAAALLYVGKGMWG